LSNFSLTELIVASKRNDLGVFAVLIPLAPATEFKPALLLQERPKGLGIERKFYGQRNSARMSHRDV
jgi:hypothetical protein